MSAGAVDSSAPRRHRRVRAVDAKRIVVTATRHHFVRAARVQSLAQVVMMQRVAIAHHGWTQEDVGEPDQARRRETEIGGKEDAERRLHQMSLALERQLHAFLGQRVVVVEVFQESATERGF